MGSAENGSRSTPELDVVTFGEALAVFLAEPQVPLAAATGFRRTVAGAELNVAVGLARLGHRVGWFGRVGADVLGESVVRALRAEDVDVSRVRRDPAATGLLIRDCHTGRPAEVLYHRAGSAGSRLHPDDVDPAYVEGARVLHVSGITPVLGDDPRAATDTCVTAARAAGVSVSFDPNIRRKLCEPALAAEILRPLAAQADLVLAGEDEAELLSGRRGSDAAGWFLDRGARLVVLKRGARGAWATDGHDTWEQPAHPVPVVDTVGAGDAFAAGLLSAWLRDVPPPAALREAALVAALVVNAAGDLDGLPTAAHRDALLSGGDDVDR